MKALLVSLGACAAAVAVFPAHSAILSVGNSLARTCFESAEARARSPSNLTDCNRALTEALDREDRVATLVNRGILHSVRNDYVGANRDFDEAIVLDPSQPEAWLNKAILIVRQDNSAGAVALADRALALKTRNPALAFYVRGIAHEDAGNIKAAYADLVQARNLAPGWNEPVEQLQRYRVR